MTWPDWINGSFEFGAGLAVLNHCRVLYIAKKHEGVSIASTAFFWSWGCWNLYYYPHLDQWISFVGGLSIMLANLLWLCLMIHYAQPWWRREPEITVKLTAKGPEPEPPPLRYIKENGEQLSQEQARLRDRNCRMRQR